MTLVTITYNVWDHARNMIPTGLSPEIWFRPVGTSYAAGLMSSREVLGSLDSSGAGAVKLESVPGMTYVPVLRWLSDPSQNAQTPENRARGYDEWTPFYPGAGGPIDQLPTVSPEIRGVLYGFGNPPAWVRALSSAVYLDINGPSIRVWGPEGAAV